MGGDQASMMMALFSQYQQSELLYATSSLNVRQKNKTGNLRATTVGIVEMYHPEQSIEIRTISCPTLVYASI